jgi:curved DNA-binding protein CbpA
MPTPPVANTDPFDLLGVSEFSSDEVIDAAWRRRIRLCHPDNATDDADRGRRLAKSIALNQAHDVLLDPGLKEDALLERRRRTAGSDRPGYTPPEQPLTQSGAQDEWAGATWSSYRAGGHPEARGTWSYSEPAAPPQADAQPQASISVPRNRALRIVVFAFRVIFDTVMGLLRGLARLTSPVWDPWWPFGGADLYDDEP